MKRLLAALALIVFFVCQTHAQVGKNTGIWDFEISEPAKSAVLIEAQTGHGSGICLDNGKIVTAYHVIKGNRAETPLSEGVLQISHSDVLIKFQDGSETSGIVLKYDAKLDIALILPRTINTAQHRVKLAKKKPKRGDRIRFAGFGRTRDVSQLRSWSDRFSRVPVKDKYSYDTTVLHGDSGGGCFNDAGELVGLIQQGHALIFPEDLDFPAVHLVSGPTSIQIQSLLDDKPSPPNILSTPPIISNPPGF